MRSVRKRFDGMLRWMQRPFVLPVLMIILVMGVFAERTAAATPSSGSPGTTAAERRTSVSTPRSTHSTWFHDSALEDADEPDDSGEPLSDTEFVAATFHEQLAFDLRPSDPSIILFVDPSGGLAPAPGFRRPLDRPP
jgi:hypothetical protein